jgi:hypothetical protein
MLQNPSQLIKDVGQDYPLQAKDGIVEEMDPLSLDIEDKELAKVLEDRIQKSKKFFEDIYQLSIRRQKNETYYLGRQIGKNEKANRLRPYEGRYQDNALYEIEASIKPVALSKMPDLLVTPGNPTKEAKETAKNITTIIDDDIKTRERRKVLAMAFKHLPIYFTGIIKVRWDPEKGEFGDYTFENVHPENVVVDEQTPINDANAMKFIAQAVKMSVQEVVMRFPQKEEEFLTEIKKQGIQVKQGEDWKQMATQVKIWEVWFTWYKKKSETEYERIEGVLWKFGDCILKKMKNPNFDYEGYKTFYTYDQEIKKESTQEELMAATIGPQLGLPTPNIQQETTYRNYFQDPEKPYYFMGFDQLGKIAYDETSRIEQNIYNQENIDNIGKRIIEKLRDRGKHIFSKESGLTGKDLERMDMNNPDQDILAEGDVNKVHAYIQPPQPTQQEFAEIKMARDRMFTLAGATNLNGTLQSDVATSNQIAREANFSRVDDLTEETINTAAEWMARWSLQMIKLRYTQEHMRKILGSKGDVAFMKLKSDMIDDGMEIKIKASGTDKQKRKNMAMEMAKLKMIDPLSFYEDLDLNDPVGRTEKMLLSQTDPATYMMKFVMNMDMQQGIDALNQQPMPGQPGPQPYVNPVSTNQQQPVPGNTSQVATEPPTGVTSSPQGQ